VSEKDHPEHAQPGSEHQRRKIKNQVPEEGGKTELEEGRQQGMKDPINDEYQEATNKPGAGKKDLK